MSDSLQGRSRTGRTFGHVLEMTLSQLVERTVALAKTGVAAGALLIPAAAPLMTSCGSSGAETSPTDSNDLTAFYGGKADWFKDSGVRDTSMVSYMGNYWTEQADCNYRGGCMAIHVFLKLRVAPVANADLEQKRVGVVYRPVDGSGSAYTLLGNYFATLEDGSEEWHVMVVRRPGETSVFTFAGWYDTGEGRSFYDDNHGEFHPVSYVRDNAVIQVERDHLNIEVDRKEGVSGSLSVLVANLDYDKDIRMVWTVDGWKTVNEFGMGHHSEWDAFWLDTAGEATERWKMNLAIPGEGIERFEFAVVYRHGVVNSAQVYEYWDNNEGLNYAASADF